MAKSKIMAACLSVVLALGVCAGMALAAPATPEDLNMPADLNAEGYSVQFENPDADGAFYANGANYYVIADGASTLTPKPVLFYQGPGQDAGEPVPEGAYTASYQKLDEEQTRPGNPIWADIDETSLEPDQMYRVKFSAVGGSGFEGTWDPDSHEGSGDATFWIVTKYTLWPYEASLGEGYAVDLDEWPWVRYDIPAGEDYDLTLSLGGDELEQEGNYTVQWCDRRISPDTIYDEEKHAQAILDGKPTDPGEYYAAYQGTGDYREGGVILFDIVREIAIERIDGGGDTLWSDEDARFQLRTVGLDGVEGTDWDLVLRIGKFRTFDDEAMEFTEPLPNDAYTYDSETRTLTISGEKVLAAFDGEGFVIRPYAIPHGAQLTVENVLAEGWAGIGVREARIEYNGMRENVDMLPGWRESVNQWEGVHVEDSAHPDGWDGDYEVTNVEVESQQPADEGAGDVVVVEAQQDENDADNRWWDYEAKAYGEATLRVTYRDPEELGGEEGSKTFTVNVARDVYRVDVHSENGSYRALPGGSIQLVADGRHETDYDVEGEGEQLSFVWSLGEGVGDDATIEVDPDDSSKATVRFRELEEGELADEDEEFRRGIPVNVTMMGVEDGEPVERAANSTWLEMANRYNEIWPMQIDRNLPVGGEEQITAEVRKYPGAGDAEYDVVEDVAFRWDCMDTNAVAIIDANGAVLDNGDERIGSSVSFTIQRKQNWNINFRLTAEWGDYGYEECWYWFDEENYDVWLDSDTDRVYNDGTLKVDLDASDNVDASKLAYTVGIWHDDAKQWARTFEEGADYRVDEQGNVVLDGAALFAKCGDRTWIDVVAKLEVGDNSYEGWRSIEVREVRVDRDREWDRNMLPGWDGTVQGIYNVFVENTAYPDGENLEYTVTDVQIESQQPDDDGEDVLTDFHPDSDDDNNWWYFRADKMGTATIKVTYKDPVELGGGTGSYTFDVHVSADVYELHIDAEGDSQTGLPGESITLVASAVHHNIDGDVAPQDPRYEWRLRDDNGNATITPDPDDPAKATVTFRDLREGEEGVWEDVWVELELFEGDDENPRAYGDICLRLESEYTHLYVTQIDRNLPVGEQATVEAEVRKYPGTGDAEYDVVQNATFRWEYVDTAVMQITYDGNAVPDGGITGSSVSFDIKRLETWGASFKLVATWDDWGYDERWFDLDELDIPVWEDPTYEWAADNSKVTATRVRADDPGQAETETVNTTAAEREDATCEAAGSITYKAEFQNEAFETQTKTVVIPSLGHSLSRVEAAAATCEDAGVVEHWKCDRCGKLFADEAGTSPISDEDAVVAALGHEWGTPTYEWASDNGSVTATRVCGRDASHTEAVTVETTVEAITATCDEAGEATFTAAFVAPFEAQSKTATVDALGHAWASPTYNWSSDYKRVTATRVCTRDSSHNQTETVNTTSKVTTKATYTAKGKTTYTATFANSAFAKQNKTVENIAKLAQLAQPMKVKAAAKSVKLAKVKKKVQTVAPLKVTGAKGTVSYKVAGGKAKSKKALKLNTKTGKITVKKGTKKGTYSIKVKVTAKGNTQYKAGSKTVTVKVKVK